MTPKEKAQELIAKFNNEHIENTYVIYQNVDESKRCALIAVDEITKAVPTEFFLHDYWYSVINEIKNFESNT